MNTEKIMNVGPDIVDDMLRSVGNIIKMDEVHGLLVSAEAIMSCIASEEDFEEFRKRSEELRQEMKACDESVWNKVGRLRDFVWKSHK